MPELISDLREAARTLVREFRVVDGSGCFPGNSAPECHLLMELDLRGVATATELGDILLMEKSSLSRIITRLTKAGLIDRDTAATDRRQRHLKLTRDGRTRVRDIHDRADDQVRRALSFVAEPDRSGVLEGLQRYAKALRYARLSDEFHIRPMKEEDNPSMARIIRDVMTEHGAVGCGYSIGDPEVSDMFNAYQGAGAAYFVVVDGHDTVLGGAGVGPLPDAPNDTCELKKMYFRPELRGAGMGLQMLRHCLHTARLLGYSRCYLETLDSMHQARHLYRKLGFTDLEAPVGNTGHHACNRWMMREL
ncbi:MAG: helix-turn-helix domain-containing GNAT family N-acetyltransferase [Pseudomonadota bacterium]